MAAVYQDARFQHQITAIKYLLAHESEMRLQTVDLAMSKIEKHRAQQFHYLELLEKAIRYHSNAVSHEPLSVIDMQRLARCHRILKTYCSLFRKRNYEPIRYQTLHLMAESLRLNSQDPAQTNLLPRQAEYAVEILSDLAALVVDHFTNCEEIQAMLGLLTQIRLLSRNLTLLPQDSVTKLKQSCLILKTRNIDDQGLHDEVLRILDCCK
jgi:hypothetical protein